MSRRLLALSAVLMLSFTATQAEAARKLITFVGVCDVVTLTSQDALPGVWGYLESTKKGSCEDSIGAGTVGKATLDGRTGRWLMISFSNETVDPGQGELVVQYPFVSGGAWLYYQTKNGAAVTLVNSGTYNVGQGVGAKKDAPDFRHAK